MNIKKNSIIGYFVLLIFLNGCIGGGTHGSIKSYGYPVRKEMLQTAVEMAINQNSKIHRDSVKYDIVFVDGGKKDTLWDNYYNDGDGYVTIFIKNGHGFNEYIFRYYGSSNYWDTSKTSEIFIAYAYDEQRRGGSEGNGGVKWYNTKLKKRLVEPFERELVDKVDSILGLKHREL